MLTSNDYCPECGGVSHSDSPLVLEHSDLSCSFRWDGERWKPLPLATIEREYYGDDLSADFDEAFNTLFDELDKLPKEHRTKAFNMLSDTPWFKGQPEDGYTLESAVNSHNRSVDEGPYDL